MHKYFQTRMNSPLEGICQDLKAGCKKSGNHKIFGSSREVTIYSYNIHSNYSGLHGKVDLKLELRISFLITFPAMVEETRVPVDGQK